MISVIVIDDFDFAFAENGLTAYWYHLQSAMNAMIEIGREKYCVKCYTELLTYVRRKELATACDLRARISRTAADW